jgi:Peptidase family M23
MLTSNEHRMVIRGTGWLRCRVVATVRLHVWELTMRTLLRYAVATMVAAAQPAVAQSLKSNEILSSIAVRPISSPNPVRGADGRIHLAYELTVTNPGDLFTTIDKVEAVDRKGHGLASMDGDRLRTMIRQSGGKDGMLPPGGSAIVFMDVSFTPGQALPAGVASRITVTRQGVGPDGKPMPLPKEIPVPATVTFTTEGTRIGPPAVVIEPPLRGPGWLAESGCCDTVTPHRGAVMAVNGRLRVPERFAIDWEQIDTSGHFYSGDPKQLSNWKYYGVPVHSVAAGKVVNLYNGSDEQVPGEPVKGLTTEGIGGNMLVIDIGRHNYAFYAHLQRGSLRVKLGDRVRTGQVLGLVGNTGNSTAPHLHFHVMDGPSPLNANGLPYVFSHFVGRGVIADADAMERGEAAKLDAARLSGPHTDELPMNNQFVDFQ